jgi:hypothetical protein
MKRTLLTAVVLAACVLVPAVGAGAAPQAAQDAVCPQDTQTFTGTARDLIVPQNGLCLISGATITRDVIQRDGAGAAIEDTSVGRDVVFQNFAGADISNTTIGRDVVAQGAESGADIVDSSIGRDFAGRGEESGANILRSTIGHDMLLLGGAGDTHLESVSIGHDFTASNPATVQTGHNSPNTPGGPVNVAHDFTINGSPDLPFVFDGLCNLTVAHDVRITNRTVNLGIGFGGHCEANGQHANNVGHDLVMTGLTAKPGCCGPSSINVINNHVGHDLVFSDNTAVAGGTLEVAGNTVNHDATCDRNNPAVAATTPNVAGHANTCR